MKYLALIVFSAMICSLSAAATKEELIDKAKKLEQRVTDDIRICKEHHLVEIKELRLLEVMEGSLRLLSHELEIAKTDAQIEAIEKRLTSLETNVEKELARIDELVKHQQGTTVAPTTQAY